MSRPITREALAALIAFAATAMVALPADAQGRFAARMFDVVDVNADGQLTQAEMDDARARRFDRLDTNDDGAISQAEIDDARARVRRFMQRQLPDRIAEIDVDGNGVIDEREFVDRPYPVMRFDANRDGAIDRAELDAAIQTMGRR